MMTYVISEGRLLGLTPSEWSMMLGGVALCGFITLLFWLPGRTRCRSPWRDQLRRDPGDGFATGRGNRQGGWPRRRRVRNNGRCGQRFRQIRV